MESFFFNITDSSYKVEDLLDKDENNSLKRVDISNGIVFLDAYIESGTNLKYSFKNLDRMLVICVIKEGLIGLKDNFTTQQYTLRKNSIDMFISSRQDIEIEFSKEQKNEMFVLCIADFILKRYVSDTRESVVDFLYAALQKEVPLKKIDTHSIDAISLYIIEKIKEIEREDTLNSLRCEYNILEFMIHRFKLLDIEDTLLNDDEICISKSAQEILLKSFVNPPTIGTLAHLCATNETKLKTIFKKRYKSTIYTYIQNLRLQKANLLLRQQNLKIGEIAKEVGYKHQGHFSKLFFEHYGVYPKDLLKK